ncbi:trypsin-3-like [Triplophysa rosa]|uniref:Peptidase S1 domain-containing protein n=1 Tax=Triplophysa rosa TaxID=992332 RepID=A0A9W7WIV4_TRIRA|nr:trypsin-3-like [Triplophysa rosa]KAI7803462.1 hypothetical protein IRJ41_007231 [Triplophysa rosa]
MTFQITLHVAVTILLNIAGCLCQSDVCGQAPSNTKIVGGADATEGSWPWQASIQTAGSHFCGGSLINKDWVLSAAHCFQSTTASNIKVYFGLQTLSGSNPNAISMTVTQIINHPGYTNSLKNNDIALLKLSSSVTFNVYIRPVCLAADGSTFGVGTKSWVTGWGLLKFEDTQLPNTLQEVQIPIVSNTDCNQAYQGSITSNMLCAAAGGKDSCQGDSGGPMVFQNATLWVQSGIVSFGHKCAVAGYPGVYARVSQYQSWISSYISSDQLGFVYVNSTGSSSSYTLLSSVSHTFFIISLIFSLYLFV